MFNICTIPTLNKVFLSYLILSYDQVSLKKSAPVGLEAGKGAEVTLADNTDCLSTRIVV